VSKSGLANIGMVRFEKGLRRLGLVNVYPGLVGSTLLSSGATKQLETSARAESRCFQVQHLCCRYDCAVGAGTC
jgi:hypothetical protein